VPLEEAVSRSSLVVVLVDHDAVRALPAEALAGKLLVDTRGVFSS
jgi:UDP-N-acetyl-D-mannosaminuronic acid dehydrogenase